MVQRQFVSGRRSAVCAVHHRHIVAGHLRHTRWRAVHHHGVVHAGHGAHRVFLQGDGDQGGHHDQQDRQQRQPGGSPFRCRLLNPDGGVVTDDSMMTKTPGLFCVGDMRTKQLRQVITAAADGAIAGAAAYRYLEQLD